MELLTQLRGAWVINFIRCNIGQYVILLGIQESVNYTDGQVEEIKESGETAFLSVPIVK